MSKKISTGSEFPTTEAIRKKIFKIPLLPQEQIVDKFLEMDRLLEPLVMSLCHEVPLVQDFFQEILFRVASGQTAGKNYFHIEDHEDDSIKKRKKTEKKKKEELKPSEARVMKKSFGMLSGVISKELFEHYIRQAGFLRGIYESSVELFISTTKTYAVLVKTMSDSKESDASKYCVKERELKQMYLRLGISSTVDLAPLIQKTVAEYGRYAKYREEVVSPYFRLIYKLALKYAASDSQVLNNFQNGVFGLMKAVKCYTPSRFAAFSVVAKMWIRQTILLDLKGEVNFIKIPIAIWNTYQKLEKVKSILERTHPDPTLEMIATAAKMPIDRVKRIYENAKLTKVISLQQPTQNEKNEPHKASHNQNSIQTLDTPETELVAFSDFEVLRNLAYSFDQEERLIFGLLSGCTDIVEQPQIPFFEIESERLRQRAARHGIFVKFK